MPTIKPCAPQSNMNLLVPKIGNTIFATHGNKIYFGIIHRSNTSVHEILTLRKERAIYFVFIHAATSRTDLKCCSNTSGCIYLSRLHRYLHSSYGPPGVGPYGGDHGNVRRTLSLSPSGRARVLAGRIIRLSMKPRYLHSSYGPPGVGPYGGDHGNVRRALSLRPSGRARVLAGRIIRLSMKPRYLHSSYGPPGVGPYGGDHGNVRRALALRPSGRARLKPFRCRISASIYKRLPLYPPSLCSPPKSY